MTVAEVIEELKKYPPDMQVFAASGGSIGPVASVELHNDEVEIWSE